MPRHFDNAKLQEQLRRRQAKRRIQQIEAKYSTVEGATEEERQEAQRLLPIALGETDDSHRSC